MPYISECGDEMHEIARLEKWNSKDSFGKEKGLLNDTRGFTEGKSGILQTAVVLHCALNELNPIQMNCFPVSLWFCHTAGCM